jgi:hypothetical protein
MSKKADNSKSSVYINEKGEAFLVTIRQKIKSYETKANHLTKISESDDEIMSNFFAMCGGY